MDFLGDGSELVCLDLGREEEREKKEHCCLGLKRRTEQLLCRVRGVEKKRGASLT